MSMRCGNHRDKPIDRYNQCGKFFPEREAARCAFGCVEEDRRTVGETPIHTVPVICDARKMENEIPCLAPAD
jgi:hypothetical protein